MSADYQGLLRQPRQPRKITYAKRLNGREYDRYSSLYMIYTRNDSMFESRYGWMKGIWDGWGIPLKTQAKWVKQLEEQGYSID